MSEITVNCSSTYSACYKDENLEEVPKDVPVDTRELDLGGNNITNITVDSFLHLSNLATLSLKNSNVSNMSPDSFVTLTQIKSLQLAGNSMTSLPDGVFRYQGKLENLDIGDNPLKEIRAQTLIGLTSMTNLRLTFSTLKTIDDKTFKQSPSLSLLQMDITQINNFQTIIYNKDSYPKATDPPEIVVEGRNTILCNESMCWMKEKEREGKRRYTDPLHVQGNIH